MILVGFFYGNFPLGYTVAFVQTILGLVRAKSGDEIFDKLNEYKDRQQELERYLSSSGKTFFGG